MINHTVHHADVIAPKGASYRMRGRGIDTLPSIRPNNAHWIGQTVHSSNAGTDQFLSAVHTITLVIDTPDTKKSETTRASGRMDQAHQSNAANNEAR